MIRIVTTIAALALALFSATNLYAANGKSNSSTNDSWQSFANNDHN